MKINILGASGTGVTTMGQTLSNELNVRYLDSDDYFWEKTEPPFTSRREPHERNRMIKSELLTTKNWILGGSVIDWGNNVFPYFDLVVFLYLPSDIRVERLKRRELETYGDVIVTNPARREQFEKFIDWAVDYDNNSGLANRTLYSHEKWLGTLSSPIIRLVGDLTTDERVQRTIDKLNELYPPVRGL